MTFIDFIQALSFWQAILFIILALIFIELTACIIFSPITKRLDALIRELRNQRK